MQPIFQDKSTKLRKSDLDEELYKARSIEFIIVPRYWIPACSRTEPNPFATHGSSHRQ